jgi:hypothetical protein
MTRVSRNVKWLALTAGVLTPVAVFSLNPQLGVAGLWLPVFLAVLLWREGEIPVLLFAFMLQWLEVFTGVFYSNVIGVPMNALFGGPELTTATALAGAALGVAAIGARLALIRAPLQPVARLRAEAADLSINKVGWAFAGAWILAEMSLRLAGYSAQFRQLALAFAGIEQAAFFLVAYVVMSRKEGYGLLLLLAAVEIGGGIGGFFADFKQPLFILFLAAVSVMTRLSFSRMLIALSIVAIAVLMGIVWSVIKLDYRNYVSGYTGQQIVVRPWGERIGFLADRVSSLDSYDLARGVEKLADRISYVEFFGYVLRWVPSHVPYENGRLVTGAVEHVAKPRLLFPDKPALEDDTKRAERYTGIIFHSARQTSIGIGYVAEAYIDFGRWGMFVPILGLGLLWGLIYRFFMWRIAPLYGAAFAFPVLVTTAQIGLGFNKVLGGTLTNFAVIAVVAVFVLPRFLPYLREAHPANRQMPSGQRVEDFRS